MNLADNNMSDYLFGSFKSVFFVSKELDGLSGTDFATLGTKIIATCDSSLIWTATYQGGASIDLNSQEYHVIKETIDSGYVTSNNNTVVFFIPMSPIKINATPNMEQDPTIATAIHGQPTLNETATLKMSIDLTNLAKINDGVSVLVSGDVGSYLPGSFHIDFNNSNVLPWEAITKE